MKMTAVCVSECSLRTYMQTYCSYASIAEVILKRCYLPPPHPKTSCKDFTVAYFITCGYIWIGCNWLLFSLDSSHGIITEYHSWWSFLYIFCLFIFKNVNNLIFRTLISILKILQRSNLILFMILSETNFCWKCSARSHWEIIEKFKSRNYYIQQKISCVFSRSQ